MAREIDRGTILSAVIVATFDKKPSPTGIEIRDLSRTLARLDDKGVVDLSDFSFSPGGDYSEDLARFVGNFLLANEATSGSPLSFSEAGLDRCRKRIADALVRTESAAEVKVVLDALQVNLGEIVEAKRQREC